MVPMVLPLRENRVAPATRGWLVGKYPHALEQGGARAYGLGNRAFSIAAADLNGDTHPDLVVSNDPAGDVVMLFGYGDGTFRTACCITSATCTASHEVESG
jgi:FG-GAP repeat protein